ncbi:Short-chain dehydrogenase/reductase SDR [Novosphingobium resinovorum]|uniref:Short-chain dehydrogenase/reductase SDR n=1 Tax=Novosphingobium resinovorum TaxID=158500 RepID=A0A031JQK0_9SPHN|nr:SDR family oxidoreductase [Novosphingobium resinovorum]EZP78297.1 Short-chain dehydrogenase/reductase SDR [Novosphingobium resinovorum]
MRRLEGRVAIVTGGASGIGLACVNRLTEEGALVVSTDLQLPTGGDHIAALHLVHDVRTEDQWIDVVGTTIQRFGRLDILVNNAGITSTEPIEDVSLENWENILAVNLTGTMLGCKHAIRAMRENPGGPRGSIVNISSMAGFVGLAQSAGYNATKGGVRLLTKSVPVRCAGEYRNIRCNSLHPGAIDTPIHERRLSSAPDRDVARAAMDALQPVGRMGTAEEMAACVAFLASDDASFVTGIELVADGGWLADGGTTRLPPTVTTTRTADGAAT